MKSFFAIWFLQMKCSTGRRIDFPIQGYQWEVKEECKNWQSNPVGRAFLKKFEVPNSPELVCYALPSWEPQVIGQNEAEENVEGEDIVHYGEHCDGEVGPLRGHRLRPADCGKRVKGIRVLLIREYCRDVHKVSRSFPPNRVRKRQVLTRIYSNSLSKTPGWRQRWQGWEELWWRWRRTNRGCTFFRSSRTKRPADKSHLPQCSSSTQTDRATCCWPSCDPRRI